ncbi:MAG: leucine-rich repeat domain-containing protein [Tepidibacter sp.]|jgi:hypothetical protein|uniref:leucine-rich repeat domain-containing protein n=1 Tax=Tepidibacter sp. TaxID=2529387 RepID=UPI0025DC663C|nr:leucine-rich repeat domain-containing protein [Tepidibacter sp.]MCT4507784.1 leucine-rich repeat domain-containing protein [Tepidibacter sp.]
MSENQDDTKWQASDFTFEGTSVTGFTEDGLKKLETNKDLVLSKLNQQGKIITDIASKAFENKGLTSVTIPDGLTGFIINTGAFEKNQLNKVSIPDGVSEIDAYAFNKNSLKYVDFPGTLKKIGNSAFAENNLVSATFSEDIENIALDRFSFYKNQLTSVTILKDVKKIHGEAFKENKGHQNDENKVHIFTLNLDSDNNNHWFEHSDYHKIIVLAVDSVKEVQPLDVDFGTKKEDINIPKNIKMILNNGDTIEVSATWSSQDYDANKAGEYTFTAIYDLPTGMSAEKPDVNVKVTVGNKEIEQEYQFSNGKITGYSGTETEIVIPSTIKGETVTSIGLSAFKNKGLTSVDIPDTVETIEMYAFAQNSLTSVNLPKNLTSMGNMAFALNKLESVQISKNLTVISTGAFYMNKLTSVEIPEGVTDIAKNAFKNNQLQSVTIPVNVTVMGTGVFDKNENIIVKYSNLVKAIESAENTETDGMTTESVQALRDSIEAAKTLNNKANATLAEVNKVVDDINNAIEGLKEESKNSEVDLKETVQPEEVKDENKEAGNKEEESKTSEVDSKEIVQPKEAS